MMHNGPPSVVLSPGSVELMGYIIKKIGATSKTAKTGAVKRNVSVACQDGKN